MSDTGADTEVSLSVDGVTITKSYETDEFPVPAIAFELRSTRDDEAMVRLVDPVPDGVPPADLGFHPEYGSEHWSVEDGSAVFERRLTPDEEYLTVYGIRTTDHDPARFMTEPTLDVRGLGTNADTTEATTGSDTAGRDSTRAARDVISGEGDVAGLEDEPGDVDDVDISGTRTTDATDTPGTEATATTGAGGGNGTGDTADGTTALPAGGIGAALATEIREGDLSDADRELLREELKYQDSGSEVRIKHLQSRMSDLEAYIDALEEFVDENGPARQLIEDTNDQLEVIEAELDTLDERTTENAGNIDALEGRADDHENDIDALDDRVAENAGDIDALDKGIADAQSEIADTQASVADLREDVDDIEEWRSRITSVLGGVSERSED